MKFYKKEKRTHVVVGKEKAELMLAFFREKVFQDNERALRVDSQVYLVWNSFSTAEIEAAVVDAGRLGSNVIVLDASTYADADAEAAALAALRLEAENKEIARLAAKKKDAEDKAAKIAAQEKSRLAAKTATPHAADKPAN